MKRVCLRRAKPRKGRKQGRCVEYARPEHVKKSATPRKVRKLRKAAKKKTKCLRWAKTGKKRCLRRAK